MPTPCPRARSRPAAGRCSFSNTVSDAAGPTCWPWLTRSLPNLSLSNGTAGDIDPTHIQFLGHSLGAIVGSVYLGVTPRSEVGTATLAMPGGGLADLLRDSPTLGPRLAASLAAQGLM